ncbi:hypothetical protein EV121DRAFT_286854 [Schizophyllum commune]
MAQPVSRGDFFHDGTMFYVEIEGKHRHPRCDASSLHGLLTYTPPSGPAPTKKDNIAKGLPPPHKDPPPHFYTAQMIHYGLKPLKTRDPAKKKLLAAFGGSSILAVPAHILQLEQQLATEFAVNNKGAAKQPKTKKAKEAKRASPAVTLAKQDPSNDAPPPAARDPKASKKAPPPVDVQALRSSLEGLKHQDLVKIILHVAKDAAVHSSVTEQVRELQAAAPLIRFLPPPVPPPAPTAMRADLMIPPKPARTKQTARKSTYSRPPRRPLIKPTSGAFEPVGTYELSVPEIEEEWPQYGGDTPCLDVCPSSTGAHLWASFDFGVVSGVFKSFGAAPTAANLKTDFRWRGREEGEGEMQLGQGLKGYIKFLDGGSRVQGCIEGSFLGKAEFTGELVDDDVGVDPVDEWKRRWRGINMSAYEVSSARRWGKWGGEAKPDKPDASDTSGGEEGVEDDSDGAGDMRMAGDDFESEEEKPRGTTKPRTKQTARRGGPPAFGVSRADSATRYDQATAPSQPSGSGPAPRYKTKQTARRGGPSRPQTIRVPANTPFRPTGSYTIVAEDFADLCSSYFDEENMILDVRPSSTGAHLWGKFDFGALSGMFRSTGPAPTSGGKKVPIVWRGRDSEAVDGRTWYDEGQTGFIKFLSGGKIKGCLEGYMAKGDFTGQLFEEEVDLSEVAEWKSEWRSLNEADSIASSKSSWGKWTAQPRADRAAASDTSGGEGDSMDVDEDGYY